MLIYLRTILCPTLRSQFYEFCSDAGCCSIAGCRCRCSAAVQIKVPALGTYFTDASGLGVQKGAKFTIPFAATSAITVIVAARAAVIVRIDDSCRCRVEAGGFLLSRSRRRSIIRRSIVINQDSTTWAHISRYAVFLTRGRNLASDRISSIDCSTDSREGCWIANVIGFRMAIVHLVIARRFNDSLYW